ncbi:hypothetical protein F5888DRAFT_1925399 [Russula emetica]|nr:hypothetical protein F5888DRAFT_1925399 [Russula emetica]
MANIGDLQRYRLPSSESTPNSTPPSSPPSAAHTSHVTTRLPTDSTLAREKPTPQPELSPAQSLELRIRWLEAILYGAQRDESLAGLRERKPELRRGETLILAAEHVQRRMNDIANTYDVLRRFIGHYEQHAQFLTPAFALSGTLPAITPPEYKDMSPTELAALTAELEPDIRAADNDMRGIDDLQQKGITGAGTLSDHEALQPRLESLLVRHQQDVDRAAALEKRVASIVRQYAIQIDGLSELFVAWDEAIRAVEDRVGKLEKEREEWSRRGFE